MPESMFELTGSSPEPTPVVETPAPSETPTPEVKKEETPIVPETKENPGTETPANNLMELPDGRKVTPEEFQKQWKEHFYPEFTRKSQKLAEYEKNNPPKPGVNNPDPERKPWEDPGYEPKTYAEIIEIATKEAEARLNKRYEQDAAARQAEIEARQEIENKVTQDLEELKKLDPNLDETKLFSHASKYGFSDLKLAYANFSDTQKMLSLTEEKVLNNLKKRETPVAGSNNPKPVPSTEEVDRSVIGQFSSASDYLRSLSGK